MKLFKIVQKTTEGQCDAMRCKEAAVESGVYNGTTVNLCKKHARELIRYNATHETAPPTPVQIKTKSVAPAAGEGLKNILVSNLAIEAGAVESRQNTAEQIRSAAKDMEIFDIDTRDNADKLLAYVHEEEKQLKAEIAAMYKPVKDAAKATKDTLDSWFGETLRFYSEAKAELKEKLGLFLRAEKEKENLALAAGDHDTAVQCLTESTDHVSLRRHVTYAIENGGANLPLGLLAPDESKLAEILPLLPRELLIPNYDLINDLVQEHGTQLQIPDVRVIVEEKIQMKGGRKK